MMRMATFKPCRISLQLLMSIVAMMMLVALLSACFGPSAPRLQIDRREVDLGEHFVDGRASFALQLKNVGKEDLVIKDVEADCSYMNVWLTSRTIQKRKAAELQCYISFIGLDAAHYAKRLQIRTNNPQNPIEEIDVTWNLVRGLTIEPSRINQHEVESESIEQRIILSTDSSEGYEILAIRAISPHVELKNPALPTTIGKSSPLEFIATIRPAIANQRLVRASIGIEYFQVHGRGAETITVPVLVTFRGEG